LGIDTIDKYAGPLGIGQKTGVDLPGELAGLLPSQQWKMKTFHEKWYAGEVISVGIGQGALEVTPIQLVRALSGIASDGHLVRPHVLLPDQLTPQYKQAVLETYAGTGDRQMPLNSDTWMTITEGMAQTTQPGPYHTAEGAHLEGIDFAGKTGTAQVVGGGDTHNKGGARTPNAWFVGMVPRRNPEFAVVVLQEHGDFGSGSAKLAAQIITAYVNKKRKQDGNLVLPTQKQPSSVEVGAVWSTPGSVESHPGRKDNDPARVGHPDSAGMAAGRFEVAVDGSAERPSGSIFPDRDHRGEGLPSGAKAPAHSESEMYGLKPVLSDSGKIGGSTSQPGAVGLPERIRRVVSGGTR
jgi:penicillin-binding protein 2